MSNYYIPLILMNLFQAKVFWVDQCHWRFEKNASNSIADASTSFYSGTCSDSIRKNRQMTYYCPLQFDEKNWCVSWDWSRDSDSIVCEQRTWRRFQTDWKLPPTIFGVQTSQNFKLHQCCGVVSWCIYTGKLNVSNTFQADTKQKIIVSSMFLLQFFTKM